MKKIYLLFIVLTASLSSKAQYVTLADPDFAIWLMNLYPGCFSGFEMDTTCFEIMNEESLALHNTDLDFIENLDGIQYFKSLKNLEISGFTVGNPNSSHGQPGIIRVGLDCLQKVRPSCSIIT